MKTNAGGCGMIGGKGGVPRRRDPALAGHASAELEPHLWPAPDRETPADALQYSPS